MLVVCDVLVQYLLLYVQWLLVMWQLVDWCGWWWLCLLVLVIVLLLVVGVVWEDQCWGLLVLLWLLWLVFSVWWCMVCMGYYVDDVLVVVCGGWWYCWWWFVEVDKVQVLCLLCLLLDCWLGIVSFWLDMVGVGGSFLLCLCYLFDVEVCVLQVQLGDVLVRCWLYWQMCGWGFIFSVWMVFSILGCGGFVGFVFRC